MKIILSLVATSVVLLLSTSQAFGQVELSIDDVFFGASEDPQSGSVEILISHELASDPLLAGFQVVLEFSSDSAATLGRFLDVEAPVDLTYALDPFSIGPVGSISADGSIAQIGDFLLQDSAALSGSGDLSLGRIDFEIPGGTQVGDEFRIDFRLSPDETFLATDLTGRIPFSTDGAVIRAVPEPSSAMPLIVLLSIALLRSGRKRIAA